MRQHSTAYTVGFAAAVCLVCSLLVSGAAVGLKDRQEQNKLLERQKRILALTGLFEENESLSDDEVRDRFERNIVPEVVHLEDGRTSATADPATFDQREAMKDPGARRPAPENEARLVWVPDNALVYKKMNGDIVETIILPIEGKGLWSTMYGFLALTPGPLTVTGITFYEHGETPGLGGEIDNSEWKRKWKGRKVYGDDWKVRLKVIKGTAGSPEDDPYRVDGLTGATLTSNGVSYLVDFWQGESGFAPYLRQFREQRKPRP